MARPSQDIARDELDEISIPAPVLYRCFDEDDVLLYVGFTNDPQLRFKQHRSKPWWPIVSRITLHSYRNFKVLEQDEARAIRVEQPKFNKVGKNAVVTCGNRSGLSPDANIFGTVVKEL